MSVSAPLPHGCPSGLTPPSHEPSLSHLSAFVREVQGTKKLDLSIRGATCANCLGKIERSVSDLPGMQSVRLNLSSGHLAVAWQGDLAPESITETIQALGYGVSVHSEDGGEVARKREERSLLIAMAVAGFAAANIMLLSVSVWGGHSEMGETTRQGFHLISGLIALPVVLFSGRHFFLSAFHALKAGHVNMDVPISLAISLAFFTSVWETIRGGPHAYFDACVMLLFFLLIGRFLDARLRRRAYSAAHGLAALQNQSVTRIGPQGTKPVKAEDIAAGDTILLAPGERAVIDMRITEGCSDIDESLVSGESLPRQATSGQIVYSGSVNLGNALKGHALAAASDSLLADISRLLQAGEQRRSTYRKIADKAVSIYVPFVHLTALAAFTGWIIIGAPIRDAILIAVSTLIITCPCALALAAPVTQIVAASRLFREGVFLRSGDALERLAAADHIVFDKTGTLTLGEPMWAETPEARHHLKAAARLARASRHPLSRALTKAAGPGDIANDIREFPGLGLICETPAGEHRLGSAEWVQTDQALLHEGPLLWYSAPGLSPIPFLFRDELRADATDTVAALKASGYDAEILSGDRAAAVERTSKALGIDRWAAAVSPQDKATRLEDLRHQGKRVLMVGDGLNDAGALSLAHASLAPGGAMDVSQAAADAVFQSSLSSVPAILRIAKRARRTLLQNFALAALYNFIAVPIAVTGHVTPLIAAIAMSASSLIVTLNALRLRA
ncbi:MAG: heavy metal translocating P-type ATPase [Pseudomonadota bacterium]